MEEVFELFEIMVVVWTAVLEAKPRQGNPLIVFTSECWVGWFLVEDLGYLTWNGVAESVVLLDSYLIEEKKFAEPV